MGDSPGWLGTGAGEATLIQEVRGICASAKGIFCFDRGLTCSGLSLQSEGTKLGSRWRV
jgi:hypothetical protein